MTYVDLGKTGLSVSRLGFGGIPIQRIDKEGTRRLFNSLAERGINFIDTARAYTVSEECIGYAIEGRREKFVLATKSVSRTREAMAADIETSLNNLSTDYIDLYQIHNATPADLENVTSPGGALEALKEAKEAGKIGHIGLTSHSLETFRLALDLDWVETFMFPYNIVETDADELIKECSRRGIGFIVMKPLAGGAIRDARLALRYVASNPNVTTVIPGMYSTDEIAENHSAVYDQAPLTEAELDGIARVKSELGGLFCRRCGYCSPCTVGIIIPSVFLFDGYLTRYGLTDWATERYNTLKVKASACIECGACEPRCPYGLPIRQMLRDAAERFDK